ncbi:TPA: conjugative transfer relaxase/helicase TraI [Vibrio parahaemolyticus]|nr:conjugative transfer relaxase/helicase TraI [Vibrio parahaemolyticus]
MMSISPLRSPSNAAQYYLNEENTQDHPDTSLEKDASDNYYLKEKQQGENTFWHGKLAQEAGLLGKPVEQKTLETILSGTLNDETIKGKREDHKSGFDLTFSAPKNASILALVGGDSRLIEAHNNAVKFALSELEKDVAQATHTNEAGKREFHNTQSMIFAVVRHKTSRNNDPQVHSHALAANMTRDQEGNLRTLASNLKQKGGVINGSGERIYHFQKYYTALYQSQFARESEELGFQTKGLGNAQFDIDGVPEPLHKAFSTRKQQIDQQVMEFGHDTQASRDTAALDTRQRKTYHSDATLNHKWQQTVKGEGFDPALLVKQSQAMPQKGGHAMQQAHEAFSHAMTHLGQHSTSLSLEKVIEVAASDFTKGTQQANAIDLKQVADEWIKNGQLVPLSEKGHYTSQTMLKNEKALMDITKGRTHNMRTNIDEPTLNRLNIAQDNRQKVADIYGSTKQFHVVNVFGSSEQIAQNLLNAGNHSGKRVQLVSQNTQHHRHNQQNIPRESHTFATWVKHLFQDDQRHTLQGLLDSKHPLTNKDIILVDNANKMSANELLSLSEKAGNSNSKVILLNRVSNRQGMKAHSAIDLYSKGNVTTHTWVNSKQADSVVRLHNREDHNIALTYADLPDKTNAQVLATSGVEQRRLNNEIRAALKNDGQLSRTSVTVFTQQPHYLSKPQQQFAKHYQSGMTLRQWDKGKSHDFVIASVDKASNTLEVLSKTDGKASTFDPSSKAFQSMNMQLYKPDALEISQGERILATNKHFPSQLEAGHRYLVTSITKNSLTLTNQQGQSSTLPLDKLKDAPLKYDYVHSANHFEPREHTLLSGKAFTLSKELLNDLTESSARLDIFTDHPEKAQQTLAKAEVRPSAIERVLHTQNLNDRYLSEATEPTLRHDIEHTIAALAKEQQAPVSEKAVNFALNHLSEKEAGFTQKELVIEAVRYAFEEANSPITKAHIEAELAKRSDALSAEYSDGTRWTIEAAIETEKHILRNIEKGKGQHKPFSTSKQVHQYLENHPSLTHGQGNAIHLISTTPDSFVGIQGLAGTGKSTMLETNIELIKHVAQAGKNQPDRIIGLAPTHSAVGELESKGVKAQTLESLLTDIRQGRTSPEDYKNTLFFLDESSMVSNRQAKELTDLVLQNQSKAVLLGDKEQLLSLNAGKPFELAMTKGIIDTAQIIDSEQMTDIIRQRNKATLGAVHNILDKQPDSALDKLSQQGADRQGKTQHVISTLTDNPQYPQKAQQIATEKLPYEVAQDYLSRTQETRENTLIIAYTNNERDAITEHIRHGLIKKDELGKENVIVPRLRSIGASGEELKTMMPYQKGLVLSTKPGQYGTITKVDSEHGVVMIKSHETGQESAFLPRHRDHKFTALFSASHKPLSTGDKIITRFTDKSRGIKANVVHHIVQADNNAVIAQSKNGQSLTIDPEKLKDGHWDYAYTRTADMAQGATYQNVITSIKGKGALTNLRRAYIDLTRASEHVRLYTDNPKQMMKSWLSKEVNKASAIETVKQITPQSTTYFNDNALPHEDVRYQNKSGDFDYNKFREHIDSELPKYTESLATHLLGAPNKSKSDRDYLTFGTGKSAIKVSLTGDYRGYFKDYTTGEKGSLINLMMSHKDLSYKEAMNEAHHLLNNPEHYQVAINKDHEKLMNTTPKHVAQFEQRAKDYLQESQELKGTLAEQYLNKLGIQEADNDNIRFHPAVYSSEDQAFHPAMIANIHNQKGETRAIEITYLDHDANKDIDMDVNPRVLGTKSKQMTAFNQGWDLNTTIISTGIEQSFIINEHTQGQYDIINVNQKNDIQNISPDEVRQNVIIVLTNQNLEINSNNMEKIIEKFSSPNIHFVTEEDMIKQITDCVQLFEGKGKDANIDISNHEELPIKSDNHHKEIIFSSHKDQESKELEHFDHKEHSPQRELDLNKEPNIDKGWGLDRELER